MRIILGVSGGIAAYKAVLLLRLLKEAGHSVRVIPTKAALKFVGKATWEALSVEKVTTSVFKDVPDVAHVALGAEADLVIVAPATADLLARAACGRADDLLTATLLVATCPVVMAPAMHTQMWQHPATVANVATLRLRGIHIIEPASGRLTGSDSGPGRLPDPEEIAEIALGFERHSAQGQGPQSQNLANRISASNQAMPLDLTTSITTAPYGQNDQVGGAPHCKLVVTAGGTREPIDPVRWIGNRSSGKQGIALAQAGAELGMEVVLIAANIDNGELAKLRGNPLIGIVPVETCLEMLQAVRDVQDDADAIVMAAAVADYRPVVTENAKLKKQAGQPKRTIELIENPDILAGLCEQRKPDQVIVGFAAETGDNDHTVLEYGQAKALKKQADLLAVNDVSEGKGFGVAHNKVWLLDKNGELVGEAEGSKTDVARAIVGAIADRLPK